MQVKVVLSLDTTFLLQEFRWIPDSTKNELIINLLGITIPKEVQFFWGHAGYYHGFVENFTRITFPLFHLLSKDYEFVWIDACQSSFESIKQCLSKTPILQGLYWSIPFHISIDASNTRIGALLGHQEEGNPYAIYVIGKTQLKQS